MQYEIDDINVIDEATLQKKEGRIAVKSFSRIFWGLILYSIFATLAIVVIEVGLAFFLDEAIVESVLINPYVVWGIDVLAMYVIAFPLFLLYIKPVPARKPLRDEKLGVREFIRLFLVSVAIMQLGNLLSNIVITLVSDSMLYETAAASDMISSAPLPVTILVIVIIGPIVEELIFRRAIIDRLGKYGERMAIIVSSVAFGMFHGNLNQFVYATLLGLILGNTYVKTGKMKYPIILHMLVNLFGTLPAELMERTDVYFATATNTESQEYLIATVISIAVPVLFVICIGLGIIVLLRSKRTGLFEYYYECEIELSFARRLHCVLLNSGAIVFYIIFGLSILMSIIPAELFLT